MKKRIVLIAAALLALLAAAAMLVTAETRSSAGPAEFTFLVVGDSQPHRPNAPQTEVFKKLVKRMDTLNPAFVVHTGDAIYGAWSLDGVRAQVMDYREAIAPLRAKVYRTIGNHEIQGQKANQAFFEKELGGLYYSFDHEGSHFIVLNCSIIGEERRIAGKQLEWLREDLRKAQTARHKFVFLHMPLYPVDGHGGKCIDSRPAERDALHKLFMLNRVDTVFSGHEHLFDEHPRNGVRYVITGGGGGPLWPSYKGTGDFHHFIIVRVKGDAVEMKGYRPAQRGRPEEEFPIGKTKSQKLPE